MKIYKESFHDVRDHMLEWIRVAYAPALVWALGAAFMGIIYWSTGHSVELHQAMFHQTVPIEKAGDVWLLIGFANLISFITYIISAMTLYINGFRYGILHEGGNQWWNLHLNKRFVRMILYSILVPILGAVYLLTSFGIVFISQHLFSSIALNVILGVLLGLFGCYVLIRIGLFHLLISIDGNQPLKTSWNLLKGNVLRFFGLIFLIMMSILIIAVMGIGVLALLGYLLSFVTHTLTGPIAVLIYLFGVYIWFLNWAVTAKALSLVYTSFTEGKV